MNSLFRELDRLLEAARREESLRRRLLDTRTAADPMDAFCSLPSPWGMKSIWGISSPPVRNTATTSARAPTAATPAPMTPSATLWNFSSRSWNRRPPSPNNMGTEVIPPWK